MITVSVKDAYDGRGGPLVVAWFLTANQLLILPGGHRLNRLHVVQGPRMPSEREVAVGTLVISDEVGPLAN